jgi:hypothetical protein
MPGSFAALAAMLIAALHQINSPKTNKLDLSSVLATEVA